jgi:Yip1-like protein
MDFQQLFQQIKKRVIDILTTPESEWRVIRDEGGEIAELYINYIIPLAAIPAASLLIGLLLIGAPIVGRYGVIWAVSVALASYVSALVAPIVGAVVIEQLAPKFKSSGDTMSALKLVAYASTPVWIAGVVNIIPLLSFMAIVGALYGIYLFYIGLPVMMKTPQDQLVPYMVVSAIAIVVVVILLNVIARIVGLPMYGI